MFFHLFTAKMTHNSHINDTRKESCQALRKWVVTGELPLIRRLMG